MLSSRPRYEDKLFYNSLDACIEGLSKFPVDKRPSAEPSDNSSGAKIASQNRGSINSNRRPTPPPPLPYEYPVPLSSPHTSPTSSTAPAPQSSSRTLDASTEKQTTMSSPVPVGGGYGGQDARSQSHYAIQPSATPTKISLKKAAVKMVRPAGAAAPNAPPATHLAAKTYATPSSSAKKASVRTESAPLATPHGSLSDSAAKQAVDMLKVRALAQSPSRNAGALKSFEDDEADLDALFARLTSLEPSKLSPAQSPTEGNVTSTGNSNFVFTTPAPTVTNDVHSQAVEPPSLPQELGEGNRASNQSKNASKATGTDGFPQLKNIDDNPQLGHAQGAPAGVKQMSSARTVESERKCLQKALDCIPSLSNSEAGDARLISAVSSKLNVVVKPNIDPFPSEVDDLKSKIIQAATMYLNKLAEAKSLESVDPNWLRKVLAEDDGNFFGLCAKLIDRKLISLGNVDEVIGLCDAVMNVLPKHEVVNEAIAPARVDLPPTVTKSVEKEDNARMGTPKTDSSTAHDPIEIMTTWPSAEKRDNISGCRTVILKGASHPMTVNQIQALVWGGRIESIHLPEPGKSFAMIKFQTPHGCQKYFDATENGIEMPGATDKKKLVFVERQPGPNSVNDLLQNCIKGNFTRCVRAVDADDDWPLQALKKLAQGSDKSPREIDTIKQGKTAQGRHYIEFRFANIYHALSFKRALSAEEDWEPCVIDFAEDPCAVACGVQMVDDDEASKA